MPTVETVTLLFTDLVGSTSLSSHVGPAAADQLRQEHFGLLREALAETGGDEVKNLGDGLMATFASASSAVACGVAMQQRMELRNRAASEQLSIRVGIAHGEADHDEQDWFGPPVVEASRLCNRAEGGQILVGELARMMAGGRHGSTFTPVGALELKGLPEPVEAFAVDWEPAGAAPSAIPLPGRLRGVPPVGYVGRDPERERIAALWAAARDGARRTALISGEPGIGKTRLATHSALEIHGEGATVLHGHCEEDLNAPYGAWIQALRHFVEHAPEQVLATHAEQHGGELLRLVPGLRRRLPDLRDPTQTDSETERYLLFGAVAGLLEVATGDRPLVLLLDDLHWADVPTLALLKHVVAASGEWPLLVLGTYRDSDLSRDHPLTATLADLRREEGVERIALEGLSVEEIAGLMAAAAGHEMDERGLALAAEIAGETDGNPFFSAEMLRHLSESGTIVQGADGRWQLTAELSALGLPQSVREVVGRRVERLGEEVRGVLSCAAVIGRDFDVDLLARVVDEDEDRLLDLLERAVEASVLVERGDRPGAFSFSHALVNHTLYDDFGSTRRARMHRRVAEALEDMCGDDPGERVAELALHWSAASAPQDPQRAVSYSRQAGDRALAELAPDEAMRWFTRALELSTDGDDRAMRCDLLTGLGEAQRQSGKPAFRESLLEAGRVARELGDAQRLATAVLTNTRGQPSLHGSVDEERVELIEAALEATGDAGDLATRAGLLALLALELNWDPDCERRRSLSAEALGLARQTGDAGVIAHALHNRIITIQAPETLEERSALSREVNELAEGLADPGLRYLAHYDATIVAGEMGDMSAVDAGMTAMGDMARAIGQPSMRWTFLYTRSCRERLAGRLDEAEALAEEAAQVGADSGEPDAFMFYAAQLAGGDMDRGVGEQHVDLLRQSIDDFPRISGFVAGLAAALCEAGEEAEAQAILDGVMERGLEGVPRDQIWLAFMMLMGRTAGHLSDRAAAQAIYAQLDPWRDQIAWNSVTTYGSACHYLAVLAATLGDDDRARRDFGQAAEIHQRIGAEVFLARTRIAWARHELGQGRLEHARELLAAAAGAARELGLQQLEQETDEALSEVARV